MNIKKVQKNILGRYAKSGRKLPRRKTRDPYAIHVSEVMLQQTQVDRVIPYFHKRMKDFPDYQTLAKASKIDLLTHRSGLGFNSRALRLQECAKIIVQKWKNGEWKYGTFPKNRDDLQKLPGVGPYTSAAIMAFAWNMSVPVIDTNIRRVFIFLFKLSETITAKKLELFAEKVIPKGKSRDRHNALIDQGALLLTARKTKIKSLSKQSKFEGSDRQVRGTLLKQLVKNGRLRIENFKKDFPHKDVEKILKEMQKEELIQIKKGIVSISE